MLLVRGKGGKERMVPLGASARIAAAVWIETRDEMDATAQAKGKSTSKFLFPSTGPGATPLLPHASNWTTR